MSRRVAGRYEVKPKTLGWRLFLVSKAKHTTGVGDWLVADRRESQSLTIHKMKRYGKLWSRIVSRENLEEALRLALRRKTKRGNVLIVANDRKRYLDELEKILASGPYRPKRYAIKILYEPKLRIVYAAPFFPDRIVHHAIMRVLEPIYEGLMSDASFSCRKGKGQHKASKLCMSYARKYKYCLQCDCSQFYVNIDHGIMQRLYRWKIKDQALLETLDAILTAMPTRQNNLRILHRLVEKGVSVEQAEAQIKKLEYTDRLFDGAPSGEPIGNLLSQWDGNLYMTEFDHWVRQTLKCHPYIRFCDDFLLFSDDKAYLQRCKQRIKEFLFDTRKIVLSKAEVFPTSQGVDFCGYRHFNDGKILVRKRTATRIKKRVGDILTQVKEGKVSAGRARSAMGSTWGILKHAKTHNLRKALNFELIFSEVKALAKKDEALL